MSNKKATKRALLTSITALAMCVVMLVGTTFAWFTDTAKTNVNRIEAGKLDVELLDKAGDTLDENEPLKWVKDADGENQPVLWEPNCTYNLEQFQIKNAGNLALKYKVVLKAADISKKGDKSLLDVIEWTVKVSNEDGDTVIREKALLDDLGGIAIITDRPLKAHETETISITGHMKSDAGNDYQNLHIDKFGITVLAAQYTYEYDSESNQYDADATYPIFDAVSFKEALDEVNNSDTVHDAVFAVTEDLSYDGEPLSIAAGKNIRVDLGGNDLTLRNTSGDGITVNSGASLTLADSANAGKYVFDNASSGSDGIYVYNGEEGKTAALTIEGNVQINVDSNANSAIHAYAEKGNAVVNIDGAKVTINGTKRTSAIVIDQNATLNMNSGELDIHADFDSYSDNNDVVGILLWGQNGTQENNTLNMSGGKIRVGGKNAFAQGVQIGMKNGYSQNVTANITGGTIELAPTENGKGYAFTAYKGTYGKFAVSGGEVTGNITALGLAYSGTVDLTIAGGSFGVDPTDYVAGGCTAAQSNGVWTVTKNS